MKKLSWKLIAYILFIVALFGYRFASDAYMETAFSEVKFKKDSLDNYSSRNDIYYPNEPIEVVNEITGQIAYFSWGFVPTNQPNDNREAKLLLVSENNVYSLEMSTVNRPDVYGVYKDRVDLNDLRLGTNTASSIVNLPNGTYQMYIYVWENENAYGLTATDQFYKKDGTTFTSVPFISQKTDVNIGDNVDTITMNDLNLGSKEKGENINISGWIFMENIKAKGQKVYAQITNEKGKTITYTALGKERADVSAHFGNELYRFSGVDIKIPYNDLEDGKHYITMFVSNNDQIQKSDDYVLEKNAEELKWYVLSEK